MIWSLAKKLPPEVAHRLAVRGLGSGFGPDYRKKLKFDRLRTSVAGLDFPNPLGLAAGFDKNAEAIRGALRLGFGFVEVGTITPRPQAGNPKPRVFRLPSDGAVINRYGFNNQGMEAAFRRLKTYSQSGFGGIVGVNIGANRATHDRIDDYYSGTARLSPVADYVAVNVSSPNTPGLRGLQSADSLKNLLAAVQAAMRDTDSAKPVFLKIAPDLDDRGLDDILEVALEARLAGVIIANTTIARPKNLTHHHRCEEGGLSGRPLLIPSSAMILKANQKSDALSLVAVGGVFSAESAYLKILLGASLVQIYTALTIHGAGLPRRIISGLDRLLAKDGYQSVEQARGAISDLDEAVRHVGL